VTEHLLPAGRYLRRQAIGWWCHRPELLPQQRGHRERRRRGQVVKQAQVEVARVEPLPQVTRVGAHDAKFDPRVFAGNRDGQRLRDDIGDALQEARADDAGDFPWSRADLLPCPLELGEGPAGALHQQLALGGQDHPLPCPVEQRHADLFLQRADLPGHGRLHHVQHARRRGNAARLGDRHEGGQLPDLHSPASLEDCLPARIRELYPPISNRYFTAITITEYDRFND